MAHIREGIAFSSIGGVFLLISPLLLGGRGAIIARAPLLLVMIITVVITVRTRNLAVREATGVLVAAVMIARRVAHFTDWARVKPSTPPATGSGYFRGTLGKPRQQRGLTGRFIDARPERLDPRGE